MENNEKKVVKKKKVSSKGLFIEKQACCVEAHIVGIGKKECYLDSGAGANSIGLKNVPKKIVEELRRDDIVIFKDSHGEKVTSLGYFTTHIVFENLKDREFVIKMHINLESSDVLIGFPFLREHNINILDIAKTPRKEKAGEEKMVKGIKFKMNLSKVEQFLLEKNLEDLTDEMERENFLSVEVNLVDFKPRIMRETRVPEDIRDEVKEIFEEYCEKSFWEKVQNKSKISNTKKRSV